MLVIYTAMKGISAYFTIMTITFQLVSNVFPGNKTVSLLMRYDKKTKTKLQRKRGIGSFYSVNERNFDLSYMLE